MQFSALLSVCEIESAQPWTDQTHDAVRWVPCHAEGTPRGSVAFVPLGQIVFSIFFITMSQDPKHRL